MGIQKFWKRKTFANQLIFVFLSIFLLHLIIVQMLNGYYVTHVVEEKLVNSSRQTLRQAAMNVENTLARYEELTEQLVNQNDFQRCIKLLDGVQAQEERKVREEMEGMVKEMMAYQTQIRCFSLCTVGDTIFGYDRMQLDLLYQKINDLHLEYYEENFFADTTIVQGKWTKTAYLDRWGTREYYVYSYGKRIQDWILNKRLGIFIVSIEETSLAQICEAAQISHNPGENYLLIVDEEGTIISHKNKTLLGTSLLEQTGWSLEEGEYSAGDGFMVLQEPLENTGWSILSVISRDYLYEALREAQNLIWMISLFLAAVIMLVVVYVSKKMSKEVKDIVDTMQEVGEGELSAKIGVNQDERNELSLIANGFNAMMNKVNDQMELIRIVGKREKEAEIRALEAQINPHFIYNTLDSIHWLAVENDQPEISQMLSYFAQILRYQIQKSNTIVTLQEELGYLEKYLYLQKIRFVDSFEYVLECQDSLLECQIYKMIFQPFIENAILHGCAELSHGGLLKIQIRDYDAGHLAFIVSDNGCGMTKEQIEAVFVHREKGRDAIGVENVLARLDMYYGEEYQLQVESEQGKGTVIRTVIPKQWDISKEEGKE